MRSPALNGLLGPLRWVTELGSTGAVTLVAILAIVLGIVFGPWLHGLLGAVTIGLASLGNEWFKTFIARNRPDLLEPVVIERGFSFPSGHSLLSMVAYGVLGVLVIRSPLPLGVRRGVVAVLAVRGPARRPVARLARRPLPDRCARRLDRRRGDRARLRAGSPVRCRLRQPWQRLTRIEQRHDPIHLRLAEPFLGADELADPVEVALDGEADRVARVQQ